MRLITFSLPAIALVAILSVSLQHSIGHSGAQGENELPASPEATHIIRVELSGHNAQRIRAGLLPFPQCLIPTAHPPVAVGVAQSEIMP